MTGRHLSLESCEEDSAEEDETDGLGTEKDGGMRAEVHFEFCNDIEEKGRDIVIPVVGTGKDRKKLVRETKEDSTLETIRTFADNKDKGYRWENGVLVQAIISQNLDEKLLIVLPKSFRNRVLKLAHEGLGHVESASYYQKKLYMARSWCRSDKLLHQLRDLPKMQ